MKIRLLTLIILGLLVTFMQCSRQAAFKPLGSWTWGAGGYDSATRIITDSQGNVFVEGTFEGTCDLDPGPLEDLHSTPLGSNVSSYIIKLDSDTNYLWGLSWGVTGSNSLCVDIDNSGNLYCTGSNSSKFDFDPGPAVVELDSEQSDQPFIFSLDSDGNYRWSQHWLGESDNPMKIAVDGNGNSYVIGSFLWETAFDPGNPDKKTDTDDQNVYVVKYDSNGNFQWVFTFGENWSDGLDVAVDNDGNAYVTYDGGGLTEYLGGIEDYSWEDFTENSGITMYLRKISPDGESLWEQSWAAVKVYGTTALVDTDADGNVYVYSTFIDPEEKQGQPGSGRDGDPFVTKFSPDGETIWSQAWKNGQEDYSGNECTGICVSDSGYVYAIGTYRAGMDFDPGKAVATDRWKDTFISKFGPDGEYMGTLTWEQYRLDDVTVNPDGDVFVCGSIFPPLDFGTPSFTRTTPVAGESDAGLMKLDGNSDWK